MAIKGVNLWLRVEVAHVTPHVPFRIDGINNELTPFPCTPRKYFIILDNGPFTALDSSELLHLSASCYQNAEK